MLWLNWLMSCFGLGVSVFDVLLLGWWSVLRLLCVFLRCLSCSSRVWCSARSWWDGFARSACSRWWVVLARTASFGVAGI